MKRTFDNIRFHVENNARLGFRFSVLWHGRRRVRGGTNGWQMISLRSRVIVTLQARPSFCIFVGDLLALLRRGIGISGSSCSVGRFVMMREYAVIALFAVALCMEGARAVVVPLALFAFITLALEKVSAQKCWVTNNLFARSVRAFAAGFASFARP